MKTWEIVLGGIAAIVAIGFVYLQGIHDPFSSQINRDVDQLMRDRQERQK